jgi:taurine dioxygenase
MSYQTLSVEALSPRIGAVVSGVDLSKPLGNQQFTELFDAWMAHQVLFFRDQELTVEQHKSLGRQFGELHVHPGSPSPNGHPEVVVIHADENSVHIAGEKWHTDVSCDDEPPMGSILHLNTVPDNGGDTLFASMYAAYDALSDAMKSFLAGLSATHDGEQEYRGRYASRGVDDSATTYPKAVHPVVRTHPITGRKGLYVNRIFTNHINELTSAESGTLLEYMFAHCEQPGFQCRFKWAENSVAFWDNRCVQHIALWDYFPQVRSGRRITIKGDRPV